MRKFCVRKQIERFSLPVVFFASLFAVFTVLGSASVQALSSVPYDLYQEQLELDLEEVASVLLEGETLSTEEQEMVLEVLENEEWSVAEKLAFLQEEFSEVAGVLDFDVSQLMANHQEEQISLSPICAAIAGGIATALTTEVVRYKMRDPDPKSTESISIDHGEKLVHIIRDGRTSSYSYSGDICGISPRNLGDHTRARRDIENATRKERDGANMTLIDDDGSSDLELPSAGHDDLHREPDVGSPSRATEGTLLDGTWVGDAIDWIFE